MSAIVPRGAGSALLAAVIGVFFAPLPSAAAAGPAASGARSLDGSGNNLRHRTWGMGNRPYLRLAAANYADGLGAFREGPDPRYLSNRIFNDSGQNIFSERDLSQWGWVWGQFIDHDIALREEPGGEGSAIGFDPSDPLEGFRNDLGSISFARTPAAPGTGSAGAPRQQRNTLSSYIDASNVYGQSRSRLDWMRAGLADGDPSNNSARLLLPGGLLPTRSARGDAASAPPTKLFGRLAAAPQDAVVGGDFQVNENLGLTAVETLFAREHNRIVDALPHRLGAAKRFGIARRVVGAEEQFITYSEFLPAMGVSLPPYRGYDQDLNASVSNEFATVGFRLHSMVHGDFFVTRPIGEWSAEQLAAFEAGSIDVQVDADAGRVHLAVPLFAVFGNPGLLGEFGFGPFLDAIGIERQYRNDEQIDDNLRSILFGVPRPGAVDPPSCGFPTANPDCFTGVSDLGAIDIARGRDHGMPTYPDLRRAYGLEPPESFAAITGESSQEFPEDPEIDPADPIDDPDVLDFLRLADRAGNEIPFGTPEATSRAASGVRRSSLAARLRAVYGDLNDVDAFVGMISEPHPSGSELGPLQTAIWRRQFRALRDGDRFFYLNDPALGAISRKYGITYRHTLAQVIGLNGGLRRKRDPFRVPGAQP